MGWNIASFEWTVGMDECFHGRRMNTCVARRSGWAGRGYQWMIAAITGICCGVGMFAQGDPGEEKVIEMEPFTVSAERDALLDRLNPAQTVLDISADALRVNQASSLGEALEGLPGVGSASFGPAVGRPVIRGLSGQRVRVLADGLGTGDASAVSPDHAVALDPRLLRSATVVRGPASLFYGNSAIGGAVDVETRILPNVAKGPWEGVGELTFHSATDGRDLWLGGETPAAGGRLALNALWRDHGDQSIPGLARRTDVPLGHSHGNSGLTEEPNPNGTLPNSGQSGKTFTLGWKSQNGPLESGIGGVAHAVTYGVPFHSHSDVTNSEVREVQDVHIDLRQYRVFGELERSFEGGPVDSAHLRTSFTDYAHDEIEAGTVESSFAIDSEEAVLELFREAREGGSWELATGLHGSHESFRSRTQTNAAGAIFPATESWNGALFGVTKIQYGRWASTLASRFEIHRLALSEFDGYGRTYSTPTFSIGQEVRFGENWRLAASHTWTERAPSANELFANGGHLATGVFERGSIFQFPSGYLETERGSQSELGVTWSGRLGEIRANVFLLDFDRFVFLRRSAYTDDASGLPIFDYIQRPAHLSGGEIMAMLDGRELGLTGWKLRFTVDTLRGRYEREGDGADIPLPRMSPSRFTTELAYDGEHWQGLVRIRRVAPQNDVELNTESTTPGYTELDLELGRRWIRRWGQLEASVTLANATDAEVRNHLSYLKDVAPMPGRSLILSLRWSR